METAKYIGGITIMCNPELLTAEEMTLPVICDLRGGNNIILTNTEFAWLQDHTKKMLSELKNGMASLVLRSASIPAKSTIRCCNCPAESMSGCITLLYQLNNKSMQDLRTELFRFTSYSWLVMMLYWIYAGLQVKITVKKQSIASRLFYLVLMAGSFGCIYYERFEKGFLAKPLFIQQEWILFTGLAINISGISFAIMARSWLGKNWSGTVTIKKDHELVRTGPYSVTRHPIYTGMLFGLIGAAIVQGEIRSIAGILLFFISVHIKIATEEKFMRSAFGEYDDYRHHTKKIIPFIY